MDEAAGRPSGGGRLSTPGRPVEVSLTLAGDAHIHGLNRRYLDRDEPTDVLSFPMGDDDALGKEAAGGDPGGGTEPREPFLLGDVVVSVDRARDQASEHGRPFPEELARLVSHGVLHLLGYTDESEEASAAMHAKENAVLTRLGFSPDWSG